MTEVEWLACDDLERLLNSWQETHSWDETLPREVWLFGRGCCRRIWNLLVHPSSRLAVEVAERHAEGDAERAELDRAPEAASLVIDLVDEGAEPFASADASLRASHEAAVWAAYKLAHPARPIGVPVMLQAAEAASRASGRTAEDAEQVTLLRDILGNPFRPVTADPTWLTPTVLALASQMYESRDFSPMPILADALRDAGCENDDILTHCRGLGPHVRGCWVVDRVLGKE